MMSTVVCHTDGCANSGIPIELTLSGVDDNGDSWAVDSVQCGACGQEITDVVNY